LVGAEKEVAVSRYVIYGAGGVGGVLGGRLFQQDKEVALICRGAHHDAIAENGLRVDGPEDSVTLKIPVARHPAELGIAEDDVVVLTMKSQDTHEALEALKRCAPPSISLLCAQNGVANEAAGLRFFPNVYGACVVCATTYLAPGVVKAHHAPTTGALDLGRYPSGIDEQALAIATDFTDATWKTSPREDVMLWKHTKLLRNLGNVVHALCGPDLREGPIFDRLREEGEAVYAAAGIDTVPTSGWGEERQDLVRFLPVEGYDSPAGSTWQSVIRGAGSVETDYLNGEVVLLGRLHGVPTPANAAFARLANSLAFSGSGVGRLSEAELLGAIAA
jgi:2-dehydropantoate 2-reductase